MEKQPVNHVEENPTPEVWQKIAKSFEAAFRRREMSESQIMRVSKLLLTNCE